MIYSITAISFFLFSIYLWRENSPKQTKFALIIAMVWLTLHDGLRWEIGTDWIHYYNCFFDNDNEHMGLTYRSINSFFRLFTDSYTVFLLCFAATTYLVLGRLLYKYSPNPLMSACIFYCGTIGIMGSNRQLLALVVCIISLYFVFKRQKYCFIGMIILATSFHITALSFFPVYFLYNLSYNKRIVLLVVGSSFLVGITHLVNKIPFVEYLALIDNMTSNTGTTSYVNDEAMASASIVGSFKRLLFVYFAVFVKEIVNNKKYDFFLLLYIIGSCIYLVFNGSVLQIIAGRGATYFSFYECLVIPYMIIFFPARFFEKEFMWFVVFVLYFYLMWRDMDSCFILTGIDIYNPYKSVLF